MKQRCLRCIARIQVHKVSWVDEEGRNIHLDGPPVFLRACVLGQLEHSHPHKPSFPLTVNQQLTFDRVFTNCRDSSLLPEVMRGEHVRIEMIQINADHTGGRILARYESPAHSFLFPNGHSPAAANVVEVAMTRSRRYKCPPHLVLSTSVSLTEVVMESPLHVTAATQTGTDKLEESEREETPSARSSQQQHKRQTRPFPLSSPSIPSPSARRPSPYHSPHDGITIQSTLNTTQERLHTLLNSYTSHSDRRKPDKPSDTSTPARTHRVKLKAPLPKFRKSAPQKNRSPVKGEGHRAVGRGKSYYVISTSSMGLHHWERCPRRSPSRIRKSTSLPSSPVVKRKSILSNFRTQSVKKSPSHQRTLSQGKEEEEEEEEEVLAMAASSKEPFVVRHSDSSMISRRNFCGEYSPVTPSTTTPSASPISRQKRQRSPHSAPGYGVSPGSARRRLAWGDGAVSSGTHLPTGPDGALVRKYLLHHHPGNTRHDVASPSQLIEEKVEKLIRECSNGRRSVGSMGEDSLSEDNDRLRASFAAEREETLNRTAQMLPDDSVLVRVGPRDFWSQRMSEFTGKPHRLVFDETLERIYNRLYEEHAAST